ncbi:type II inositol 1,4,5-trisphosphate 5-phosphatase isoform X1 [Hyla sarda]|uniref:type II inositol 1,4,5-trisphosphate 5-phosphatase isoform X1 n=1 Tax=Hyla sarda TaxID=327740 RepID=UPI0024C3039F|nr:type II inositol 1,4,5-trisphosphate 5-phosphatase isoform X1 [Hyla sarda]
MDQSIAIQDTLDKGDICTVAVQGVLHNPHSNESRLVGLVESQETAALFIYKHRRMAISAEDVSLDKIIPLAEGISIEEVTLYERFQVIGSDITVRIKAPDTQLDIQLPFGSRTQEFLHKINKSCQGRLPALPSPQFMWLRKYWQRSLPNLNSFFLNSMTLSEDPEQNNASIDVNTYEKDDRPEHLQQNGQWLRTAEKHDPSRSPHSLRRLHKTKSDITHMVRTADVISANKVEMLPFPRFGLRDNLIKSELLKKEPTYTSIQDFRFFIGTYNVNGQSPKESLQLWLNVDPEPPDVYCIGFQELDLSKEAFFFNDTPKEEEWFKAVSEGLHPGAKYAKIKLIRLVGIMLLLYVKKDLASYVSEVEAETVGTGLMGRMGNKGGVAIRFRFHNTHICVVNSHLAAHVEEYERRNQDFRDICSRMQFPQVDPTLPPLTIHKHDVVLWLGDLNYRLKEVDVERVKTLIELKDFKTLYQFDQLKQQIEEKTVFDGFSEGGVDFQPTYKYDTGSDEWDTSEKCRAPAWCDRILWKGKHVTQLDYRSVMSLKTSDHKPVSSVFNIGVKVVNEELYRKTFEEIVRSLDKMENDCIPSATLTQREFHFKDVKYMQLQVQTFTIHNDGQVACQYEFISKLDEPSYSKQWLRANPSKGFLTPGSETQIELELFVNNQTAAQLNCGEEKLEDILILHLDRGKDFFLSVSGDYLHSSFGSSIQMLCYMREPIRDMSPETIRELTRMPLQMKDDFVGAEKPLDVPKELFMMVDHLHRNASQQEDLFQQPGLRSEFEAIRDCLDTGFPESIPGSNHSVVEALLLFLEGLPEPVICYSYYHKCLGCAGDYNSSKEIISMLPLHHRNVFKCLISFLRELLSNSVQNHLDVNILASIFGNLILRPPPDQSAPSNLDKRKCQEFVQQFLIGTDSP